MKNVFILILFMLVVSGCDEFKKIVDPETYEKPVIDQFDLHYTTPLNVLDTVKAVVQATNPEEGLLKYQWSDSPGSSGRFLEPVDNDTVFWVALSPGKAHLTVKVSNDKSEEKTKSLTVITSAKPVVQISTPAPGAFIVQNSTVKVAGSAAHQNKISFVRMFVNGNLKDEKAVDKESVNYEMSFLADSSMVGKTHIRIEAESQQAGSTGVDSIQVHVEGILLKSHKG